MCLAHVRLNHSVVALFLYQTRAIYSWRRVGYGSLYKLTSAVLFYVVVPVAPIFCVGFSQRWDRRLWDVVVHGQPGLAATGVSKPQSRGTPNSSFAMP